MTLKFLGALLLGPHKHRRLFHIYHLKAYISPMCIPSVFVSCLMVDLSVVIETNISQHPAICMLWTLLLVEFYSHCQVGTNNGYFFVLSLLWCLLLINDFIERAGNSERSEQGREDSLFGPSRNGMFCVKITITLYMFLYHLPYLFIVSWT